MFTNIMSFPYLSHVIKVILGKPLLLSSSKSLFGRNPLPRLPFVFPFGAWRQLWTVKSLSSNAHCSNNWVCWMHFEAIRAVLVRCSPWDRGVLWTLLIEQSAHKTISNRNQNRYHDQTIIKIIIENKDQEHETLAWPNDQPLISVSWLSL